ncbi:predicted protein [Histoplasma capsulatum var. duboisii H88]|uniref:Predicted protein n=1 Tax=Ajellomyces capsulatus (strain H88) TaxID=544711 RepID=F0U7V9_AJEC8|nr:predicted protein [Histoplasma capsulatum var. duboisii H88]
MTGNGYNSPKLSIVMVYCFLNIPIGLRVCSLKPATVEGSIMISIRSRFAHPLDPHKTNQAKYDFSNLSTLQAAKPSDNQHGWSVLVRPVLVSWVDAQEV